MGKTWYRRLFAVCLAFAVLGTVGLVPHFKNSAELVRMRNALLLDNEPATYNWTPANIPEGFALETQAPNSLYDDVVKREQLRVEGSDWETVLRIGRHLLKNAARRGGAIQSNLDDTYRRITDQGSGYCGDFADVFTGLANAAGVFSRPWAFSFDGFGGQGHIFNEIWDRGAQRWIMIDVFNNIYFSNAAGRALSAAELRDVLAAGEPVSLASVAPDVTPGFKYPSKALDYYRRGLSEWYMWWGNNVFENDQAQLVRAVGGTHRALEQLAGIAEGVFPHIRIVHADANKHAREALSRLRAHLYFVAVSAALSLMFGVLSLIASRRARSADAVLASSRKHA